MPTSLRISDELIERAEEQAKITFRSTPRQIEFWANIGQEIEAHMTTADLVALTTGEIEVRVIRKESKPIDVNSVFEQVESDRKSGNLKSKVIKEGVWYEENSEHPGYFIRVAENGRSRTLGVFEKGRFRVKSPPEKRGRKGEK